jgi:hypothetical protein
MFIVIAFILLYLILGVMTGMICTLLERLDIFDILMAITFWPFIIIPLMIYGLAYLTRYLGEKLRKKLGLKTYRKRAKFKKLKRWNEESDTHD